MKLWDKGYELDTLVEPFMTGDDPVLDLVLIPYDCLGSIAHAKMLAKIGILTHEECTRLTDMLKTMTFTIKPEDEDVHTAIENSLGELGKKLHTARSRNDQVLLDLRLYAKDHLLQIMEACLQAIQVCLTFADKYHAIPIPGRTHFQRAMPSSIGLWAASFAESFLDDMEMLKNAYWLNDQCPLGSAASYGVSLPIDRQYVSDLLGFRALQNNVLYANNSRGKMEAAILHACVQVLNDLAKFCTDIILFSVPEFGYLTLPEKYCPGSSLMPQKRNPCPFELIRAKSATLQGHLFQILEITRALPSGYNRDFQETKRPFMQGIQITLSSLKVFTHIFPDLIVNEEKCLHAFTPELFATDHVLELVKKGIPFRDAYKQVALHPHSFPSLDPVANILSKMHMGGTGNLGLEKQGERMKEYQAWLQTHQSHWEKIALS